MVSQPALRRVGRKGDAGRSGGEWHARGKGDELVIRDGKR